MNVTTVPGGLVMYVQRQEKAIIEKGGTEVSLFFFFLLDGAFSNRARTSRIWPPQQCSPGEYGRLGRVRSTLHRSQTVVLCLIPAATVVTAKHR